ncbi:hypothetical protein NEMIN01_1925 [Nematocida minor]|uniref:uncharacterized protein n=1 Tax=Nematocida minor TaxID=1912983 RepID=UPI0022205FF3|nr:uncharacterized protein NEMIN01_1925 [Nematocida minor]KAI5192296.1 hypothetical protein NEMIN01_1925 [Nematocida minor]
MERRKEEESKLNAEEEEKHTEEKIVDEAEEVRSALNNGSIPRVKIFMDLISIIDMLETKNILVVTPLSKEKTRIENSLSSDDSFSVLVRRVLESINLLKSKEVSPDVIIISKYSIIAEMGLSHDLMEAVGNSRVIVSLESDEEMEMLGSYTMVSKKMIKREFYLGGRTTLERMGILFALTKAKPIKNICIVVSHAKEERRVEVFLKAFGVKVDIDPKTKKEGSVGLFNTNNMINSRLLERYSLVIDITGGVNSEVLDEVKIGILKIITHGKIVKEDARFKRLLEQAMRYKYRIEGVIRMITPNVLQRKNDIDEKAVKHLQGALRLI